MHCHVVPRLAVLRRERIVCSGSLRWMQRELYLALAGFLVYKGGGKKSYNQKLPNLLLSIPICMRFHNGGTVLKKTAFFTPEFWEVPGRVGTRMASP